MSEGKRSVPAFFVSADWGLHAGKRSVHVADVSNRRVYPVDGESWSLGGLLDLARGLSKDGPVLVGVDLALGVPKGCFETWASSSSRSGVTFLDWLSELGKTEDAFETSYEPEEWRPDRPFFHVPAGKGGLGRFEARVPGGLRRTIDRATGGNPLFAVSGIPGTVGSGTRAFWVELLPLLEEARDFAVWPFEGSLGELLASHSIVLAESYPGLAYSVVLAEELPESRLKVAKTRRDAREKFCGRLKDLDWIQRLSVDVGDLADAKNDEDPFDSQMTATAVLRCWLEGRSLADPEWVDPVAEGSMLLAGPVDLEVGVRTFGKPRRRSRKEATQVPLALSRPVEGKDKPSASTAELTCPIPGCRKVFLGSRGGWDAHVGSARIHPEWHPEVEDGEERKSLFRSEFPSWFEDGQVVLPARRTTKASRP